MYVEMYLHSTYHLNKSLCLTMVKGRASRLRCVFGCWLIVIPDHTNLEKGHLIKDTRGYFKGFYKV